jgi:hypothetical protein
MLRYVLVPWEETKNIPSLRTYKSLNHRFPAFRFRAKLMVAVLSCRGKIDRDREFDAKGSGHEPAQ